MEIGADKAREALARPRASRSFARAHQLQRFVEWRVEWTLTGRADEIKETTIAIEAYGCSVSFHPRIDSIIRAEAKRRRGKSPPVLLADSAVPLHADEGLAGIGFESIASFWANRTATGPDRIDHSPGVAYISKHAGGDHRAGPRKDGNPGPRGP